MTINHKLRQEGARRMKFNVINFCLHVHKNYLSHFIIIISSFKMPQQDKSIGLIYAYVYKHTVNQTNHILGRLGPHTNSAFHN